MKKGLVGQGPCSFLLPHGLTSGSSFLYSQRFWVFQASLSICSQANVIGKYVLVTSIQGAIMTETAHLMVVEAQEKLGALLETLGLCNVCCRQATGISQAVQHKNNELHPVALDPGVCSCQTD